MKTSRYTDSQILSILKQHQQGMHVDDLCREIELAVRISTNGVPNMVHGCQDDEVTQMK